MYDDAISTEIRCGTYLIKKERKVKNVSSLFNEKVMRALYWIYKEEVAQSKLNSLLELVELLEVAEVEQFQSQSSRVLRALL